MDRNVELERVLVFITERIAAEGVRSGQPLTDEQRLLLNNLPKTCTLPATSFGGPEFSLEMPVPRNLNYERLIALAKEARRNDLSLNPASVLEWECAVAVSKLNRHPCHGS